jgi:hypothetical protein
MSSNDCGMNLEIEPEPTPEEREALERALASLPHEAADPRGAWWREGVRENVSPEAEPA